MVMFQDFCIILKSETAAIIIRKVDFAGSMWEMSGLPTVRVILHECIIMYAALLRQSWNTCTNNHIMEFGECKWNPQS